MKKRRISLFKVINHADMEKVILWLQTVHLQDIMRTGHFDKVLILPSDAEPDFITVISIAKSVEDCNQYEANDLPNIRSSFVEQLLGPNPVVEMLASYSCTEK